MLILVFDTEEEKNKFLNLYETYRHYVMYTIGRYIKDEYAAEDLFQEILMILAKHILKIDFSDETRARNYVITVAKNYCLNYQEKQKRSREAIGEDVEQLVSPKPDPLTHILKEEQYDRLRDELKGLDTKYRTALELKYINELDDDSIAEMLGITKKNVQMRLYRAKLMLREKLADTKQEWY